MSAGVIVVPTYEERDALPEFVAAFERAATGFDLLIVDDNSPDGTADVARDLRTTRPWLHLLVRTGKDGLGAAYRAGFGWALGREYATIGQMDVDLSHPPDAIGRLAEALSDGADVAIGSRYVRGGGTDGWPIHRQLLSRLGCLGTRLVLGLPLSDPSGGFKLWRASTLRAIDVLATESNGFVFQVETSERARRAGLRLVEVPFVFRDRTVGTSKMRPGIALEGILSVLRLRLAGLRARDRE